MQFNNTTIGMDIAKSTFHVGPAEPVWPDD